MNWLLFYLLAALHPIAFLLIGFKSKTWRQRLLLWVLLPIPAVLYCWDYYAIKNEHALMCAAEGGLKVLIQPEKTDRVRLVPSVSVYTATGTLKTYYPRITVVEAITKDRDGMTGQLLDYYDVSTAAPNPRVGQPMNSDPWTEPSYVITKERVAVLDPLMWEISEQESNIPHGTKTVMYLSKEGKVYAQHTYFRHWWTGIQYPDAVPSWRCPDTFGRHPPANEPNAPQEEWIHHPSAYSSLIKLILK